MGLFDGLMKRDNSVITWKDGDEGRFRWTCARKYIHNEEQPAEMFVYVQKRNLADYAEQCVLSLNNLHESVIREICKGIIKCAEEGGINRSFVMPQINDVTEILNHCWFTAVYVQQPKDRSLSSYVVEGEGEWGEVIGFVIENGRLAYVGVDYMEYADGR